MRQSINGILLLDKPNLITSNGALQKIKRLFNAKKAGHTGSLDPIATGMLPICFGEATKFSQYLLESDKTYYVTAKLGETTTTGDIEGEIVATKDYQHISIVDIEAVINEFIGDIKQIPPMFSAIKFQGKPLYELARRGIAIERQPRTIKVYSSKLNSVSLPEFCFTAHCSKGTYIRTLVEDIGERLGCGAHVTNLRRTFVSPYGNAFMYSFAALEQIAAKMGTGALLQTLLPIESAVASYPIIKLSASAAFYLRMGQPVRTMCPDNSAMVQLYADDSQFLGIGEVMADGRVRPHRLIATNTMKAAI